MSTVERKDSKIVDTAAVTKTTMSTLRAAVALNNIGVSLLSNSFQREATETLRNSARILQLHVSAPASGSQALEEDISRSTKAAAKTMASISRVTPSAHSPELPQVSVLAHDEQDVKVLSEAVRSDPRRHLHGIRVETSQSESDFSSEFVSAIVVYNLALATVLRVTSDSLEQSEQQPAVPDVTNAPGIDKKLEPAFQLLGMAHENIVALCQQSSNACNAIDEDSDDVDSDDDFHHHSNASSSSSSSSSPPPPPPSSSCAHSNHYQDEYSNLFCDVLGCMAQKVAMCAIKQTTGCEYQSVSKQSIQQRLEELQEEIVEYAEDLLSPKQMAGAA